MSYMPLRGSHPVAPTPRRNPRRVAVSAAAMIVALWGSSALAQAAVPTPSSPISETPPPETSSPPADADIVVTATKRAERLQDVPIAVTALSSARISNARIENTNALSIATPSLQTGNRGASFTPYIRGVGATNSGIGDESPIAIYVDGVYQSSSYASNLSFNNVDRVEILKGPQGTLFGRNATGGLIQIITRTPSHDSQLQGSAAYGNYDIFTGKLYATTGLTDTLATDIAIYGRNQGSAYGENVNTGKGWFRHNEFSARSKTLFTPADTSRFTLILSYSRSNNTTGGGYATLPGTRNALGEPALPDFYDINSTEDPYYRLRAGGASLRYEQELGSVNMLSQTSYNYSKGRIYIDPDESSENLLAARVDAQRARTYTQELQLSSASGGRFNWIVGAFYLHDDQRYVGPVGLDLSGSAVGGVNIDIRNGVRTESYSAFGEGSYNITDRLKLTVGARYTIDHKKLTGFTNILAGGALVATIPVTPTSKKFSDPTWRGILDYKISDDNLVYASYSRGFKSGGFNATDASNPPFKAEKIDAFEIGSKNQFLNRRLTVNLAAYYYDYSNLQQIKQSLGSQVILNAAAARLWGAEAETSLAVTPQFNLSAGVAYSHAHYRRFPDAPCADDAPGGGITLFACDASGNNVVRNPKFTFNLGADYTLTTAVGDFTATAQYLHNGGFYWEPDNRLRQKPFDLLNGTIGWKPANKAWGISLFAENLLATHYFVSELSQGGSAYSPAPPRTYGIQLSINLK